MWLRMIGVVVCFAGVLPAAYSYWCSYRVSGAVFVSDKNWPRPWPYPDDWLLRWEQRLNKARPMPPGTIKVEGEFPTIEETLVQWSRASFSVAAVASAPCVVWFFRSIRRPRGRTGDAVDYSELNGPLTASGEQVRENWLAGRGDRSGRRRPHTNEIGRLTPPRSPWYDSHNIPTGVSSSARYAAYSSRSPPGRRPAVVRPGAPRVTSVETATAEKPFGKAKACIVLFMWGGPAQQDTWD